MRRFYLVEDFQGGQTVSDGEVLALSPEACFELDRAGIPYRIVEDFYDEDELASFAKPYLAEQLAWFEAFDAWLREAVPFCRAHDLALICAHRFRLKYFIDSLVMNAYVFRHFVAQAEPSSIVYLRRSSPEEEALDLSIDRLNDNTRRFLRPVLGLVCRGRQIPIEEEARATGMASEREGMRFPGKLAASAKSLLKPVYCLVKYRLYERFWPRDPAFREARVLFLSAGHKDSDPVIRRFARRGATVFLKSAGVVRELSHPLQRAVLDLDTAVRPWRERLVSQFERAAEDLRFAAPILEPLARWCQEDVSDFVLPVLRHFVSHRCFETACEVPALEAFYRARRIDYVIARSANHVSDAGALVAAGRARGTRRVCFQHGCHATDFPMWRLQIAGHFDLFFAADPQSRAYTEAALAAAPADPCRVYEYGDFLKPQRKVRLRRLKPETVFYVPTRGPVGVRLLNLTRYPITWYYQLQIALLRFFATQTDKRVVFKYWRSNDWLEASTLAFLATERFDNITADCTPFWECLHRADRVVMDYPGTAFYEAAAAGVPLLALYHERMALQPGAREFFGRSLVSFRTLEDACARVQAFLDAPREAFRPHLELTGDDPAELLVRVKAESWNTPSSVVETPAQPVAR